MEDMGGNEMVDRNSGMSRLNIESENTVMTFHLLREQELTPVV